MDDGSPIGFLLLIVLLILGGAYFAAAEMALASVNRIRIMSLADNGNRRAKRVLYILDHFDKALTTILIGNNIMHIACASAATVFAARTWGVSSVTATTFVVTLLVFLFAEMLPKRFAAAVSERFALIIGDSLYALMKLFSPLTAVFSALSGAIKKPFHIDKPEPTVTEDELYDIIETLPTESEIDEETTELVQNALEFSDTLARDILTPWSKVICVALTMTDDEVLKTVRENVHSRLPVTDVHGQVIGMLQIRKYLKARLKGRVALASVMDEPRFVEAGMPIDDLLPVMSALRTQLAVVREENGETIGIVSVEDILEELVGEIYDEDDAAEAAL